MKNQSQLRAHVRKNPVQFFDRYREAWRKQGFIFELECPGNEVVALLGQTHPLTVIGRAKSQRALALALFDAVLELKREIAPPASRSPH